MSDPSGQAQGKTLWEMFTARVRGGGNGAGLAFENPLDLRVGSAMPVAAANGPEFANYDFGVQEIREYNRQLGDRQFRFTDYILHGVNTKSFDAGEGLTARVRAVPNDAGGHDALLLRLYDEFAFTEDFLAVLKDTTGILEVTDDASGAKETFTRINDLRDSWQAAVLVVTATTPDGKAAPGRASPLKLEYWDYWRETEPGGGRREFIFAEMNSETGWFQLWRGREFFSQP